MSKNFNNADPQTLIDECNQLITCQRNLETIKSHIDDLAVYAGHARGITIDTVYEKLFTLKLQLEPFCPEEKIILSGITEMIRQFVAEDRVYHFNEYINPRFSVIERGIQNGIVARTDELHSIASDLARGVKRHEKIKKDTSKPDTAESTEPKQEDVKEEAKEGDEE